MKMTPEQEAFFEYGRSYEKVCRRAELLRTARKRCAENPERYGPGLPMATMLFERTVNKAKQKRAVCRRLCLKCTHCHPGTGKICDIYDPQFLDIKRAIACEHFEERKGVVR